MHVLPIVIAFDRRYLIPALVSIKSLLNHVSDTRKVEFFCFHKGMPKDICSLVEKIVASYNSLITFIDMTHAMDGLNYARDRHVELFYPLFIPKYFSSYQYALNLDVDILIRDDVLKLVDELPKDKKIGAVRCMFRNCQKFDDFGGFGQYARNQVGVRDVTRYFNGGVVLFNLKKTGEEDYKKFLTLLPKKWQSNEESIFNYVYQGDSYLFSVRWNYQMELYAAEANDYIEEMGEDIVSAKNDIAICHFIGHSKPWSPSFCLDENNKYVMEYKEMIHSVLRDIKEISPWVLCGAMWKVMGAL